MQKLVDIQNYLKNIQFSLSKNQDGGRINSILNESEILKIIENKFNINIPQSRNWADFYINNIPVNIKITTTTADNASSKKGLYYALTGEVYTGSDNWNIYLKSLKENIKNTDKDYYFLIINKNNTNDIFINSLKKLSKLQANGNNLPFQIKWYDNKISQNNTWQESKNMLIGTLGKSLKLRANAFNYFQKYFKEYT